MDLRKSKSTVSATLPSAGSVKPRISFRPDSAPLGTQLALLAAGEDHVRIAHVLLVVDDEADPLVIARRQRYAIEQHSSAATLILQQVQLTRRRSEVLHDLRRCAGTLERDAAELHDNAAGFIDRRIGDTEAEPSGVVAATAAAARAQ